jgi:hypothetical protein
VASPAFFDFRHRAARRTRRPRERHELMPDRPPGNTPVTRLTPEGRRFLAALLAVLIFVFALVYSNVAANHAPKPHRSRPITPSDAPGGSRARAKPVSPNLVNVRASDA